ncbi:hypothetical protein ATANTOWER_024712 [Ataeniobius toweri]|uniref:Small EDRK-rich factor-like N-terminal domain-containing protein n=1 Tax=Ataeniobius toweri TaxID=208326 RepID=A0ABU7CB92_9TELE|nr:hypothetical protein [Ataeniobius toweri]
MCNAAPEKIILCKPLEIGRSRGSWRLFNFILVAVVNNTVVLIGVTSDMARGHQKFQSQQKNAKKQAEIKKSKGHDQKAAAKAALVYTCTVCRVCK